jgi:flagellar hook-associated protein 1
MSLMNGALQIGRSALLAYQSALQVIGNNVANAGSAGYARQTAVLVPAIGGRLPEGFLPGGGVALSALQRHVDQALESQLRSAGGGHAGLHVQQQALGRVEAVLNELSDSDLSTLMQNFFNAFSSLQAQPQDMALRRMALTAGDSLAGEVRRQRLEMLNLRDELNTSMAAGAERVDQLLAGIADLNVRVTAAESASPGAAHALRDQRDAMLRELAELVQIEVREQPDGGINIYIGSEQAVQSGLSRGITSTLDVGGDGHPRVTIRFADNRGPVNLTGGSLGGLAAARDTHVLGHVHSLDRLAVALIGEVNRVHAQGQGLEGFTSVTGSYSVLDPGAPLNGSGAGLPLAPRNGSFLLTVTDRSSGLSTTTAIAVDLDGIGSDESLSSLAERINQVPQLTAVVTADNRLQITAAPGFDFTFGEDSSNVLAAMGINTFFAGGSAEDIGINPLLNADPRLLAAATRRAPGDGTNAGRIAALEAEGLASLNGLSLNGFYGEIANGVAIRAAAASASVTAAEAITSSLTAQRESVSGVNLEEETLSLMRFQRAFQAAAQYSATVDRLMDDMLRLVR